MGKGIRKDAEGVPLDRLDWLSAITAGVLGKIRDSRARFQRVVVYVFVVLKHPRLVKEFAVRWPSPLIERYFARTDSKRILERGRGKRMLFVDGGANLGQGFRFFSGYFPPGRVEYDVFEPNPNCVEILRKKLACFSPLTVRVHSAALSTRNGSARLFGITEYEGGPLSLGASINQYQHSVCYNANVKDAITVEKIDFCAYLKSKSEDYDAIIVKLDIEGAETDLLEALMERDALGYIDTLYVEFHSFGLKGARRRAEQQREKRIISRLRESRVHFRRWH